MASLKVPQRFREGIFKIAELSESGFTELLVALVSTPELRDLAELSDLLAKRVSGVPAVDRDTIIKAIIPIFRIQRNAEATPSEFASDLWTSIREDEPIRAESIDGDLLKSRIQQLVEQGSIDVVSVKVNELKLALERGFRTVRIFTDLRPVFKGDIEETPSAMVILHSLRIGYHDGIGQHHEFFVTLDESDIETLSKTLARASKKAETLKSFAKQTGTTLH